MDVRVHDVERGGHAAHGAWRMHWALCGQLPWVLPGTRPVQALKRLNDWLFSSTEKSVDLRKETKDGVT